MKTLITFFICFCTFAGFNAQNSDGIGRNIPQPSPDILALNEQETALKTAGDIEGLKLNRLAQAAAWQKIDPNLAAEFKPNYVIQNDLDKITGFSQDRSETFSKNDSR